MNYEYPGCCWRFGFYELFGLFFLLYDGYRYTRFCGNVSAINNIFSFSVIYDIPEVYVVVVLGLVRLLLGITAT
jgi:hypothetical protein